MNNVILKYLRNKGYDTVSTDYYNFINIWEAWWKNQVEFHKYHDQTGKERKMFSLGMAKRLAEDWSSILFTERDEIATEAKTKEQTEVNNKYLNEQLKVLKVYKDLPVAIEKAMAIEIYEQLLSKTMANAANLTDTNQLVEYCNWLLDL